MNTANETIKIQLKGMAVDMTRRTPGARVYGLANGHEFEALVFQEHAENPEWELEDSKIQKLWIRRLADRKTVYNWNRGPDVEAENPLAQALVNFLCAILADVVYTKR